MRALDVAPEARAEIDDLLGWSQARSGPRTADRYRRLILAGFDSLREDPDRSGVRRDPELDPNLRLYALRHCRARVEPRERIAHPRHVLAFLVEAERVVVLRVLDERSDLAERLRERTQGR